MAVFVRGSNVPAVPWIYHIVHVDRLQSILKDGFLYADSVMSGRAILGSVIGYGHVKERRLKAEIPGADGLKVGDCVPFYYCPRSPMLYVIYKGNRPEMTYRGGQTPIVHLVFNPTEVATWAERSNLRYYVTNVSAASAFFQAFQDLNALNNLDWRAIRASQWTDCTSRKEAEFLVEHRVPTTMLNSIGVQNDSCKSVVEQILKMYGIGDRVVVKTIPGWYY